MNPIVFLALSTISLIGLLLILAWLVRRIQRSGWRRPRALVVRPSSPRVIAVPIAPAPPAEQPIAPLSPEWAPGTTSPNQITAWFAATAIVCALIGWMLKSSPQPAFNPWAGPFFVGSAGFLVALVVVRVRLRRTLSSAWRNEAWRALGLCAAIAVAFYAADANFNTEDFGTEVGSTLIWICAVVAAVAIAWRRRGERSPSTRESVARWEAITLATIILLALALRTINLAQVPYTIMGDETKYSLVSRYLIEHQIIKPFSTGSDGHWYLYYLITGGFINLFGSTTEAMRLPSALAGTLMVLAAYAVVRQLWGRRAALIAAALLAAYSHNIHFSRLGFNSIYDPLFSMLIFGWVWLAWRSGRRSAWLLAAVAAGLSQYFFFGGRLVLIQAGLLGVFWLITDRRKLRAQALNIALAIAVFLVLVMPTVYFATIRPYDYFGALNSKNIYRSGWLQAVMDTKSLSEAEVLLQQVRDVWAVLVTRSESSFYWQQAMVIPGIAVLAILGLIYLASRIREGPSFWLLSSLTLVLVFGGLLTVSPIAGGHRLLGAGPFIYIAVAVLLDRACQLIERWLPRPRLLAGACTLLVGILMLADAHYYFVDYIDGSELRSPEIPGNMIFRYLIETYHNWHDQPLDIACVGYNADFCQGSNLRYFMPQLLEQSTVVDSLTTVASVPPSTGRPQIIIINAMFPQEIQAARQRYYPSVPQVHDKLGAVFVSLEIPPDTAKESGLK